MTTPAQRPKIRMPIARTTGVCVLIALLTLLATLLVFVVQNPDLASALSVSAAVLLLALALAIGSLGAVAATDIARRRLLDLFGVLRRAARGRFGPTEVEDDLELALYELSETLATRTTVEKDQARHLRRLGEDNERYRIEIEALVAETARLRTEASSKSRSVSTLQDFSQAVTATPRISRICGHLLEALSSQLTLALGYVVSIEGPEAKPTLQALYERGKGTRLAGGVRPDLPEVGSLPGQIVLGQALRSVSLVRGKEQLASGGTSTLLQLLGVPLSWQGKISGVAVIAVNQPVTYTREEERLAGALAQQTALAIANARLQDEARQVEDLREIDRLKSEFISNVSHDLRTPLASIKGYLNTLLRQDVDWDDESRRDFLQTAEEEADRLNTLIENLLQISRIDAGVLHVHKEPVQVSTLAHRVVRKFRLRESAPRFGLVFAADLPSVQADATQIEQALTNLVENAVKYSDSASRVVVAGEAQGNELIVSVRDEGMGISEENLAHVFERFYRVQGSSRRVPGTGLGLSIFKGIIEAHGGRVFATSELGKGSTFGFALPVDASLDLAPPPDEGKATEALQV